MESGSFFFIFALKSALPPGADSKISRTGSSQVDQTEVARYSVAGGSRGYLWGGLGDSATVTFFPASTDRRAREDSKTLAYIMSF